MNNVKLQPDNRRDEALMKKGLLVFIDLIRYVFFEYYLTRPVVGIQLESIGADNCRPIAATFKIYDTRI